ncbi:AsmA family protein [Devosia sp. YR412]|uniref:AsmA family protein n=1 Tax=Devosia sp. YR412 TaxID=1881030 RepID=UPI0008B351CB|nr:AsmA family protein [Devosia sp. YR412]SEQ00716.1 AsmA family protein [Devosia sp. YR412]
MLNRIYIIVGLLAIVVLAGAFIAPNFIRWSDYRGRMEELATTMLGTPVTVRGDIEFSLLPQPRLLFSDVLVGSPEEPAATVDNVEAEFSLMDFLRDNYSITKLVLRQPVIDFTVDESGLFGSGVSLDTGNGGVGLGQTSIVDATVRLIDSRSGENFVADKVSGDLKLSSFSGPLSFTGTGSYRGEAYSVRLNSGEADAAGKVAVSSFLQPLSTAFSLSAEGQFQPGMAPKFEGNLVYRQKPPEAEAAEQIRGDLVFESPLTASTDRVVLSGYTLRPDENRAGTRLTGAASIQLGDVRSFDAVVSGGVFSLPPRDAKEDTSTLPYEAVRLLSELPAPIIPPMAGRVGIDLAEVGLRGFSLRNLRVDATTDGTSWTVDQFTAQLPGATTLRANGQLLAENGRPTFRGDVSLNSTRLDGLAALWRKPAENDPLFNVPGSLYGRVMLVGDAFGFTNGILTLDQVSHGLEVRLGFGDEKRLDLVGHFDELGAAGSTLVGALLPDITSGPSFGTSFPLGSFSLTGKSARVLGLDGTNLVAEGQWADGRISMSRLSAADWGGVGFDTTLLATGTLAEPQLSGSGLLRIAHGAAPALTALYDLQNMPQAWRDFLALSAPSEILVNVGEPLDGAQMVTLGGTLGAGDLNLRAELSGGLNALATAPLLVTGAVESTDIEGLTRQIGFGETQLFDGEGSMLVSFSLEGSPTESLVTSLTTSLGEENLSFSGSLLATDDGEIQGTGSLDANLADAGALAQVVGARGLSLPMASGSAQLHFEGDRLARLTEISGTSGESGFAGELALSRTGTTTAVSGDIAVDVVSAEGLAVTLFGPAALVQGDGLWPEGPLAMDSETRQTRGTIAVSAGALAAGGTERFGATSFELSWDETRMRLARFEAVSGEGKLGLDISVCCSGPLVDRTVSGRMTLEGLPIHAVVPPAAAAMLDGQVAGGVRFEGSGASLAEVLAVTAGEGNFTLTDLSATRLSPEIFPAVADFTDVLNMDPDAMGILMGQALEQGAFTAPTATGAFTIAGGVVRLANLIMEGEGAGLAGSLNMTLPTLGLAGSFAMTPLGFEDSSGLVGPDTSRIITRLAGTLLAPAVTLDLEEMIAAILVRANELEVDRLEVLQAEDAARQRAAAEERNRLIEEQRRRAAEQARIAAEEAARQAAEEEAQRLLLLDQQQQQQVAPSAPPAQTAPSTTPTGPMILTLPPQVNQPIGPTVNRPF